MKGKEKSKTVANCRINPYTAIKRQKKPVYSRQVKKKCSKVRYAVRNHQHEIKKCIICKLKYNLYM